MSLTKEAVLKYLEKNKGSYFSGETIAKELSLSRNSVWKAIESLRRDGYHIDAVSHRGYSLSEDTSFISKKGITSFLSDEIPYSEITIFDSVESTSKLAKSAASLGADHGTVIISKEQTGGNGRKNRSFFSPDGGIYFSIVLKPERLSFSDPSLITAYTAVCICQALEKMTDLKPSIKWINDIYINEKKVAGILTESGADFETGQLQWIVVGIGINFSISPSAFPKELQQKAGSLFIPGDEPISRNHLIAEILNRLLCNDKAAAGDSEKLLNDYKKRMNMLNKEVTVIQRDGIEYHAFAKDITKNGKLIIELPDKTTNILSSEEISITL